MRILFPTSNLREIQENGQFLLNSGQGVYVYDSDGREYIEGMAGLWCTSLGYGNEEIVDAAAGQMRKFSFAHLFAGKCHQPGLELADKLSDMLPVKDAFVFFGNSGSDANDTLIKLLRYYNNAKGTPGCYKIIARDRAYHGVTIAAAALTGIPSNHTGFGLPIESLGVLRTACPHYYRNAYPGESEEQFVERLVDNLEALILREGPDTIAAFIAEPVNGAGGVVVPPQGYFQRVQDILSKYNILFIDDEVITAFGRTGQAFGADTFRLQPQMMTLAKALSSAYFPISAAVVSGTIHDAIVDQSSRIGVFGHGYTYSGHPVGAAIALKVLEIYERDKIFDHAAKTGEYLQSRLRELEQHPLVGEVRGIGMIAGVELVANKAEKTEFDGDRVGRYCNERCQANGLILRPLKNTLAICPPLIMSSTEVDELVERLRISLNETLEYVKAERLLVA